MRVSEPLLSLHSFRSSFSTSPSFPPLVSNYSSAVERKLVAGTALARLPSNCPFVAARQHRRARSPLVDLDGHADVASLLRHWGLSRYFAASPLTRVSSTPSASTKAPRSWGSILRSCCSASRGLPTTFRESRRPIRRRRGSCGGGAEAREAVEGGGG